MGNWKKIVLWGSSIGIGIVLATSLVMGGIVWWSKRPVRPKPWNEKAVTATFDSAGVEGDDDEIYIAYNLKNNTDYDINIASASEVHLGAQLKRGNAMSFSEEGDVLSTQYPIFIPAERTTRLSLHLKYPYKEEKYSSSMNDDEQYDFHTKLAKYMTDEMGNLNGFVLLYETPRYQINLPPGWVERGKEPLKIKGTTKN